MKTSNPLRSAAAVAVMTLAPLPVLAQNLVVLPMGADGVSAQEGEDIVEESAYLVTDHGVFAPVRYYELIEWLGEEATARALACGPDASCLAEELAPNGIDFALGVNVVGTASGVEVDYELYRLSDAAFVATASALLSSATDFEALAGPCFEALDGSWDDPIALPAPAPASVATATPAPVPVYTPGPLSDPEPIEPPRRDDRGQTASSDRYSLEEPEPIRRRSSGLRVAGITVGAAGGGALLGGVLLGFAADNTLEDIQSTPHPGPEVEDLQAKGRSQQLLANVLFGTGAALAATGLTLVIVDAVGDDSGAVEVGLAPRAATIRVRF